jgi:hypothetical protein
MKMIKKLDIDKPVNDVWEVLGNQFGEIDKWASVISHSEVSGEPKLPGLTYSIRSTETVAGPTQQELTAFEPDIFRIAYKAIVGLPPFAKSITAEWSLNSKDDNSTALSLDFEVKFKGLGILVYPIAKIKLGKVGNELLDDLKFYVENGKPHPRKLDSISKT